jgi:hypothetical protein
LNRGPQAGLPAWGGKAIIAACVLGAAVVAVWAFTRPAKQPGPSPEEVAAAVKRLTDRPPYPAPAERPRRSAARRAQQPGRPSATGAAPAAVPGAVFAPTPPAPSPPANPALRAEEVAVRRILEPLAARRPNAGLRFVRCLEPGGWKQRHEAEAAETEDPLEVPGRDPEQAVCRVQLRAQNRDDLVGLLKDASGAYGGHLVGTDPRERLDGYLGHWWEADVQVDTQEAYPPPAP